MPIDLLADSSGSYATREISAILEQLQSAETLIVLAAVALLALGWWTLQSRAVRRNGGDGYDVVPFTNSGPIRVGARVRVSILGEEPSAEIAAIVEEIGRLAVLLSVPLDAAPRARPGTSMTVMMPDGPAAYRFTGVVQDRRKESSALMLEFPRPAWVERVQRRSHFRVDLNLPTTVNRVDRVRPSDEVFRSVLSDLSAGGMTVLAPFKPEIGATLRVRVPLPGLNTSYEVRVLRAVPAMRAPAGTWEVGCEFLALDEAGQDRIVQACFDVQRAARASAG